MTEWPILPSPSCLKVYGWVGGWPTAIKGPCDLIGSLNLLGLFGAGPRGLGPGLDNLFTSDLSLCVTVTTRPCLDNDFGGTSCVSWHASLFLHCNLLKAKENCEAQGCLC